MEKFLNMTLIIELKHKVSLENINILKCLFYAKMQMLLLFRNSTTLAVNFSLQNSFRNNFLKILKNLKTYFRLASTCVLIYLISAHKISLEVFAGSFCFCTPSKDSWEFKLQVLP